MKKFFDANYDGVEYDAYDARGGISLGAGGQEGRAGAPGLGGVGGIGGPPRSHQRQPQPRAIHKASWSTISGLNRILSRLTPIFCSIER